MVRLNDVLVALSAVVPGTLAQTCATINPAQKPTFASGYSGRVVINGLKTPRHIVFDAQGNLLATEQGGSGVRYIQLTDNGGTNVCAKASKQLIADSALNHGIALSPDGKKLYASTNVNVFSWDYNGATGTVSNRKTLIEGMSQNGHRPKTLVVPKDRPDLLLVHRGSDGNIDSSTTQIGSGKSQVRVFKIADLERATAQYASGEVIAWGVRNTVALGQDSKGGVVSLLTLILRSKGSLMYISGLWITAWTIWTAMARTSTLPTLARGSISTAMSIKILRKQHLPTRRISATLR